MFDFGFSELVVCGIVGLVVLGPERLPVVAKTAVSGSERPSGSSSR